MLEADVPPDLAIHGRNQPHATRTINRSHLPRLHAANVSEHADHHRSYPSHSSRKHTPRHTGSTNKGAHRRATVSLFTLCVLGLLFALAFLTPAVSARSLASSTAYRDSHARQTQPLQRQQAATDTSQHSGQGAVLNHAERDQFLRKILDEGIDIDSLLLTARQWDVDPAPRDVQVHRPRPRFSLFKRDTRHSYVKREVRVSDHAVRAVFSLLIPVLVILSGIFAGLTLGYMSLDETQLQVLATTGTEQQKRYAAKILPVRKDGHLLLTTLLIANMITNETLPVIADPLFSSPVIAVVVSTILVIIFAELVPQSICSRYGLQIGAYMAFPTRCIIFGLWPVGYPVSRILHWALGPHHGIVYRRAELKELVLMHAASGGRGGDLKGDTVLMVGGALDLQEKVVSEAMTPFDRVFMLPFDAKLDYPTLERIVRSGHSRIPVYQEIEVQVQSRSGINTPSRRAGMQGIFSALTRRSTSNRIGDKNSGNSGDDANNGGASRPVDSNTNTAEHLKGSASPDPVSPSGPENVVKRKKIIGVLLVKSCVLLDPEDATPVSEMTINAVPTVSYDEPLLNVMTAFQDGRSHMAIVTSLSRNNPEPMSGADTLTKAGQGISRIGSRPRNDGLGPIDEEGQLETHQNRASISTEESSSSSHGFMGFWRRKFHADAQMEQHVPADAELTDDGPHGTLQPGRGETLGIITLEDVLEEVLGEIWDEYDSRDDGESAWNNISPPLSPVVRAQPLDSEKKDLDPLGASSMPPPAVIVDDGASTKGQGQTNNATLLNRLGITGRQRGGVSGGNDLSGSPASTAQRLLLSDSQSRQDTASSAETKDSAHATGGAEVEAKDYLSAPGSVWTAEPESAIPTPGGGGRDYSQPARSASLPPGSNLVLNTNGSRPSTPLVGGVGVGGVGGGLTATNASDANAAANLASPQPNRPVVLRKQLPGGGHQNIIVGEALLRGRRPAPGTPVNVVPFSSSTGAPGTSTPNEVARSLTPKPSRFKSAPVAGGAAIRGRSQSQREGDIDTSADGDVGTAAVEDADDDEDEKVKGDSA